MKSQTDSVIEANGGRCEWGLWRQWAWAKPQVVGTSEDPGCGMRHFNTLFDWGTLWHMALVSAYGGDWVSGPLIRFRSLIFFFYLGNNLPQWSWQFWYITFLTSHQRNDQGCAKCQPAEGWQRVWGCEGQSRAKRGGKYLQVDTNPLSSSSCAVSTTVIVIWLQYQMCKNV